MKTKIFKLSDSLEKICSECADILKSGGLVAFPTETVYGLGANPFDLSAVEKIYRVKGRPKDNPLIFHISNIDWLNRLGYLSERDRLLVENFFPGPLTIILKSKIDNKYTFNLHTIAIRMPDNLIALKLIEKFGFPIVAPSANLSGKPSPTKVEHVIEDFDGKIDAIIDGGETVYGIESTVIDATQYPYKLLRHGAVPLEDIRDKGFEVTELVDEELKKRSPGTRYRHYAPKGELIIIKNRDDFEPFKNIIENKKCGFMGIKDYVDIPFFKKEIFKDIQEYSRLLYSTLRYFDALGIEVIFGQFVHNRGIGRAINDRLKRASGKN